MTKEHTTDSVHSTQEQSQPCDSEYVDHPNIKNASHVKMQAEWSRKKWAANLAKSIVYILAFGSMGWVLSPMGWASPTFVQNTGVSTSDAGFVFTSCGAGHLVGAILFGKIIEWVKEKGKKKPFAERIKMLRYSQILGVIVLSQAFVNIAIPFVQYFWLILVCYGWIGICRGCIGISVNLLLTRIWNKKAASWLHANTLSIGIVSTISPLIASPFLGKGWVVFGIPFWISSALIILTAIPVFLFRAPPDYYAEMTVSEKRLKNAKIQQMREFKVQQPKCAKEGQTSTAAVDTNLAQPIPGSADAQNNPNANQHPWFIHVLVSALISLYIGLIIGAEFSYNGLLVTMVFKQKSLLTQNIASILLSSFNISMTFGRLISVFASYKFGPLVLMIIGILGAFLSTTIMLIWNMNIYVIWIFSIITGLAISPQYSAAVSFPMNSMNIKVTGGMMSIFICGSASGMLIIPLTASQLNYAFGDNSLLWIQLIVWSATFFCWGILVLLATKRFQCWMRS